MAKNIYEGLFIFDSNRYARDPSGTANRVIDLIKKHGGEMLASRLWEERRLAYPINGQRKGTYWLSYFEIDASELVGMNREFQLNDTILRSLTLKVDRRISDALVAHTLAGTSEASRRRAAEAAKIAEAAAAPAIPVEAEGINE